jgi:ribosomal protein S18 acetylase RimI-like enzyme
VTAITVREATRDDAQVVHRLAMELARTQRDPDDILTVDHVRRFMLEPGGAVSVLVASAEGRIVGFASLLPALETSHASPGLYVSDLYVEEAFRRRGVASRLMAAAAAHAKAAGASHLWLTKMPDNEEAGHFYRRIADIEQPVTAFAVTGERFEELAQSGGLRDE